ncbi:MAG: hypothetical protein LUE24_01875 [Lachnospiraceae bacterium]|nr:hypothetical protein [Lachnospiraceae bacterium]
MTQQENTAELMRLIRENPELPILPFVDGEIPADDGGYWLGEWGEARVDEFLLPNKSEYYLFKSDDDVFDALERCLPYEEYEKLPESEEECRPLYEALPWTKAIIVYINSL